MVQQHRILGQRRQGMPGQHAMADFRVGLDDRVFSIVQFGFLAQYRIGNADLAQVMQEGADGDARYLRRVQPGRFGQQPR